MKKIVITLLCLLIIISQSFCKKKREEIKSPIPPKNIKTNVKGNNIIVKWDGVKDKRVFGYLLYVSPGPIAEMEGKWSRFSKDTNCVITNFNPNSKQQILIKTITYDSMLPSKYPSCPGYLISKSSSATEFLIGSQKDILKEEYIKLQIQEKKDEIPLVTVKELKKNPKLYESKILYIKAIAYFPQSFECWYFKDDYDGEKLAGMGYSGEIYGGVVIKDETKRTKSGSIRLGAITMKGLFLGTLVEAKISKIFNEYRDYEIAKSQDGKKYYFCELWNPY
jgi:hypothetical protein